MGWLVVGAFFQLESLSIETILEPRTSKTIQVAWIVWVRDYEEK